MPLNKWLLMSCYKTSHQHRDVVLPGYVRGFSLVELLVGMVLGIFIVLGITVFLGDTASNVGARTELGRVQDGGRYALTVISRDIKRAGYLGPRPDLRDDNRATSTPEIRRLIDNKGLELDPANDILTTTYIAPWPENNVNIRFTLDATGTRFTTEPLNGGNAPPLPARAAGQLVLADAFDTIIFDSPAINAGSTAFNVLPAHAILSRGIGRNSGLRLYQIRTRQYRLTGSDLEVANSVGGAVAIATALDQFAVAEVDADGNVVDDDDYVDDGIIRAVNVSLEFQAGEISARNFESTAVAKNFYEN